LLQGSDWPLLRQPTARLIGEVLQKKGVHRTFDADMQFSDFSFRKCHNTNACKSHQLEEGDDMFLIATDAIASASASTMSNSPLRASSRSF
jgi:hypothetical protein